ncbi:hypothetical protein B0O80DRAFT_527472 [Mortierella sp. GBAus27b]|nr:hypothetical protein BGX31_004766 [Mortierella sp. GBA43]KAI8357711.1 hypothetical protein B0O80DRAFT_527472 [Mortierella sp. GBAus27b]
MPAYSNLDGLGADFLRLVNSPIGSDVRLIIGEDQVVMYAHSLILQARSNYFSRALNSDWKEANQGVIRKPNISPAVFERILQYIYGGRLMVDDEMVMDLIKAADELCMEDLLQGCERHALTTVCRTNVLDMMQLASQHNLPQLKRECLDFIATNIDYLKRGKAILTLDSDVLKDILSMDQLDLDELEIWKIAVRWAYYQQDLDWEKCPLVDFPKGSGCVVVQVTSSEGPGDQYQDEDDMLDDASDDEYADARVPLRGTTVRLGKSNDVDEDIFRPTTHSVFKPATTHNIIKMSSQVHETLRRQIVPVLSAVRFMRIPSVDFLRLIEGTGLLPVQLCAKVYRYHSVPSMADPYQTSLRRRMAFSTILGKEHKEVILEWLQSAMQGWSTSSPGFTNPWHRRSSAYGSPTLPSTAFPVGSPRSISSSPTSPAAFSPPVMNLSTSSPLIQRGFNTINTSVGTSVNATTPSGATTPQPSSAFPQPKLVLQYRATRDGFDATNFHMACDQRGPTLTIVRADNGMIFGGYNGSSWSSHPTGVYSTSRSNFLFTLKSREHPTRENAVFGIRGDGNAAAYSKTDFGPTFGVGHDLYLSSNCHMSCQSSSTMPSTYNGSGASSTALAGSPNFRVQEYEVFLVN